MLKFSEHLTKGEIFVFFVLLKKVKPKNYNHEKESNPSLRSSSNGYCCSRRCFSQNRAQLSDVALGYCCSRRCFSQNRAQLSDVALANIEALASGEASIGSVGHETLCNVGGINMGGVIIGGCSATIVWCDGQGEGCTPVACPKHGIRN